MFEVPLIDIDAYVSPAGTAGARSQVASQIDSACRTVGFIQIVGHGIPAGVIDGLMSAMDEFFALDLEEKSRHRTPAEINRGYSPPRSESLSLSLGVESARRMNDFFEAFNIGATAATYPDADSLPHPHYADNVWPRIDGFEQRVGAYFAEAARVARVLTRIFADALGLDPDHFAGYTDHSLDVLRMNNYALPAGTTVDLDDELVGMGEHTDYGIVTVLWADQVPGLQILGSDDDWHDVSPAEGALLVNLGDLLARWTNERWMSTLHRVAPPVVDGTILRRRSAAFFHDGNTDARIETLSTCATDGPALYPPITVAEHIEAKLAGSRAGVTNTLAGRDAARVRAARADRADRAVDHVAGG
ncbi:isopenicillin N synthase family dioxygenase [Williamsia sp. SKLECPSW1]